MNKFRFTLLVLVIGAAVYLLGVSRKVATIPTRPVMTPQEFDAWARFTELGA